MAKSAMTYSPDRAIYAKISLNKLTYVYLFFTEFNVDSLFLFTMSFGPVCLCSLYLLTCLNNRQNRCLRWLIKRPSDKRQTQWI